MLAFRAMLSFAPERVLVFERHPGCWVAQCLEVDVAAESTVYLALPVLLEAFLDEAEAQLEGFPAAQKQYHKLYARAVPSL